MSEDGKDALQRSRDLVVNAAGENIKKIQSGERDVGEAKQINAALANVVAIERTVVMQSAVDLAKNRMLREGPLGLPGDGG